MKLLRYLTIFSLSLFLIIETSSYAVSNGWIDGTPLLHNESISLLKAIGKGSKPTLAPGLEGVGIQPIYNIGDKHNFYALDMRNSSQYTLEASCYAVSNKAYIFVEKGTIVSQNKIITLAKTFDQIYTEITKQFGAPPNEFDNDPRVNLLIMDIVDGAKPNGVMLLGYFSPIDQFRNTDLFKWTRKKSNETNILYIDYLSFISNRISVESIVAHEFTHLIQWARDPEESTWVDEGLAVYAESMLGYNVKDQISAFEHNPNVSLLNWDNLVENYGAAYLLFAYLSEEFGGVPIISDIMKNEAQDVDGIEKSLLAKGVQKSFSDIFSDWVIANYLDNPEIEGGKYGYSTLDVKLNPTIVESQYPIAQKNSSVLPWSAKYIEFQKGQNDALNLTVSEENQNGVNVRMITVGVENKVDVSSFKSVKMQSGSASVSKEDNKITLVVSSQPDPPDLKQDESSYTYSAESHTIGFAVTPSGSKVTTWGSIKRDI